MRAVPLLLLAATLATAQDDVIRVDVDLVNVLFTVRNKANGLVGGLKQEDFTISEDNKQQDIKYFTRETDLPLTLGLLVDVSGSQERLIESERRAADQFFRQVLKKKDMAFLISFGAEAELLQDNTNSPNLLLDGLKQLRLNAPVGGIHPGPVPTSRPVAGTILYDAVYLAANEKLKGEVGRKAVVLITDGVDTGSRISRDKAIEAAQKADVMIYSIYYVDQMAYGPFGGGGNGEAELRKMSSETGGRVFHIDRRTTLEDAFRDIQEEMRSQYSISYSPTNAKKDGSFRKIDLKASNKDYKIQARRGYYATASRD